MNNRILSISFLILLLTVNIFAVLPIQHTIKVTNTSALSNLSITLYHACDIYTQGTNYNYYDICGGYGTITPYDKESGKTWGTCGNGFQTCYADPYTVPVGTWIAWQSNQFPFYIGCKLNYVPGGESLFVPFNITNVENIDSGLLCIGQLDPTSSPAMQNLTFAFQGQNPDGAFINIFILNGITSSTPYFAISNLTTLVNTNQYYVNHFNYYVSGQYYFDQESNTDLVNHGNTYPLNGYKYLLNQSQLTNIEGYTIVSSNNISSTNVNPSQSITYNEAGAKINGTMIVFNPTGFACSSPKNGGAPYGTVQATSYNEVNNANTISATIYPNWFCNGDTILVGTESIGVSNTNYSVIDTLNDKYTKQIQTIETIHSYYSAIFTTALTLQCQFNCTSIKVTVNIPSNSNDLALQIIIIHGLDQSTFETSSMASDSILPCQVSPSLQNKQFMMGSCIVNNNAKSTWTPTHTGYTVLASTLNASASEYITNNPYAGTTNMNFTYGSQIANWAEVAIGANLVIIPSFTYTCNGSAVIILGIAVAIAIIIFILLLWRKAKTDGIGFNTIIWIFYFAIIVIILVLIGEIGITASAQICPAS